MSGVQVEQKSYEMPPREGSTVAHFLTVADVERHYRSRTKHVSQVRLALGANRMSALRLVVALPPSTSIFGEYDAALVDSMMRSLRPRLSQIGLLCAS
jgi:hypothetical protein